MAGLAAIAKPLVLLLLTEKWLPCVPFIQLACLDYILLPIHTANLTAISALGRSDYFLRLEIIKKAVTLIILFITLPLGIYAMAIGQVCISVVATVINSYPNKKLINYSYYEQLFDLLPSLLLSLTLFVCVKLVQMIVMPLGVSIFLQILTGLFIYTAIALFMRNESALYLLSLIKRK
jgi:O-antigen/teichoic acid export membrane protein